MKKYVVLLLVISMSACSLSTSDPRRAFEYWAGQEPPENFEFFNGEFYQSPHFTTEYEVYLKFRTNDEWWNDFIETNDLELDNEKWTKRSEAPDWFKPYKAYKMYKWNDRFDNSRYFYHNESRLCYIYESVGM